uniref:molybdopterin adenylyltransferase n=1 Tax=Megaselia scalaris TaxID=36166 RepID=T1GEZ7_MEGSC
MDIKNKQILILTVSDSCHQRKAEDKSGPILEQLISKTFPNIPIKRDLVPDEIIEITETLIQNCPKSLAIFTTGGTGFAPRDVTPEATKAVIQKECPQLALAMALESFKKTPLQHFQEQNQTLIVNLPGSSKAVKECYESIESILPHALQLINNDLGQVKSVHSELQGNSRHICPHKTGTGTNGDRNSPFPMIPVDKALEQILDAMIVENNKFMLEDFQSPVDIPPFRASIKDGYAMKSSGFSGTKKVVGYISAGDEHHFIESI